MPRYIDADALYKDICDSLNAMTKIGIAVDGEWLWGKLNDSLKNAPTADVVERKTVHWIPVTERLPEDDVAVLVTDDERRVRLDACGTELFTEKRFWFNSKKVLAWMPLPEPYREVE